MSNPADQLYERLLVLRFQAGDEVAFAELVARYAPRLRYFLRKLLGDHHAAEDALQEAWLDVTRSISRLGDAGAFAAWVYRIARDRASRRLRRKGRVVATIDGEGPACEPSDDDPLLSAERAEAIHAALDRLSPEHREALVLRFLEGMSYEDMSRVVGRPTGTVRSRLHYARRALRDALEREGITP
ncbi:ECF RNA polymerase sigma factor SigE [Aquisphaera giovannonii]|uniref:ECF RNA polymerase sigma factor SigE n=1 Tax=Aquisphaera giovannonii TaxID=406548 RepID=A0A5B9WD38_9BACT|nr:sigma-70 family RNA polymerase sigma factor [Aquisphaera giovannonii]QEH38403.1 ECF RNA polymerase sigma factor SigE [Aquisphaera giovannonii]